MDHFAIFCMIAGTYTPVCYLCLDGAWRWSIIATQWGLVGFGLISQLAFPGAPRVLHTIIYIVMGWIAIVPIRQILAAIHRPSNPDVYRRRGLHPGGFDLCNPETPTFPRDLRLSRIVSPHGLSRPASHAMIYTAYVQKVA